VSVYECPSGPCPSPEKAKGCNDCQCGHCPDPDKREYDAEYAKELRRHIRYHLEEEKHHRETRQGFAAKLYTLIGQRGAQRLENGCPPGFALDCVLEDGTTCPFYHDGLCVKSQEATA